MSDLLRELRSAELDWVECGDEENANLAANAASRIETLQRILSRITDLARSHAAKAGPMHSWWDSIMDAEAILKNGKTLHDWNKP